MSVEQNVYRHFSCLGLARRAARHLAEAVTNSATRLGDTSRSAIFSCSDIRRQTPPAPSRIKSLASSPVSILAAASSAAGLPTGLAARGAIAATAAQATIPRTARG